MRSWKVALSVSGVYTKLQLCSTAAFMSATGREAEHECPPFNDADSPDETDCCLTTGCLSLSRSICSTLIASL